MYPGLGEEGYVSRVRRGGLGIQGLGEEGYVSRVRRGGLGIQG